MTAPESTRSSRTATGRTAGERAAEASSADTNRRRRHRRQPSQARRAAVIYIDSSAAMKLVRPERHSDRLSAWLAERREMHVLSSVLVEVELIRATRRIAPDRLTRAGDVLRGIGVVALSSSVVARAAAYGDRDLRSLAAIHLATAEHVVTTSLRALEAFVAYDERLLAAAAAAGLPIVAPGFA